MDPSSPMTNSMGPESPSRAVGEDGSSDPRMYHPGGPPPPHAPPPPSHYGYGPYGGGGPPPYPQQYGSPMTAAAASHYGAYGYGGPPPPNSHHPHYPPPPPPPGYSSSGGPPPPPPTHHRGMPPYTPAGGGHYPPPPHGPPPHAYHHHPHPHHPQHGPPPPPPPPYGDPYAGYPSQQSMTTAGAGSSSSSRDGSLKPHQLPFKSTRGGHSGASSQHPPPPHHGVTTSPHHGAGGGHYGGSGSNNSTGSHQHHQQQHHHHHPPSSHHGSSSSPQQYASPPRKEAQQTPPESRQDQPTAVVAPSTPTTATTTTTTAPMITTSGSSSSHPKPTTLPVEQLEADRIKASADTDLSFTEVKPIQTDFHFFVKEVRDKLRVEAEQEVRSSIQKDPTDPTTIAADADDAYLINTNLNARLMKAWEDLSSMQRESYGKKEEVDRRRFMEEDEIASRHCATLTARVRSPAEPGLSNRHKSKNKKNERGSLLGGSGGTIMGEDPADGGMHEDRDLEEREEDPPHLTSDGDIYNHEKRLSTNGEGDHPEQDPNNGGDQVQLRDTATGDKKYEDEEEKTEKDRSSPHKDVKRSPLPEVDEADASPNKKNRVDNESVSIEAV